MPGMQRIHKWISQNLSPIFSATLNENWIKLKAKLNTNYSLTPGAYFSSISTILLKEREKMNKLLSGRWLFTMITGLVYAVLALKNQLPPEFIKEVTMMVLVAYFAKGRETAK